MNAKSQSNEVRRAQWIAIGLCAAVLLPVFQNGFAIDDVSVILHNTVIRDPTNIPRLFAHDTMYVSEDLPGPVQTYRPLTLISFFWDWQLSRESPWGYHLTNWVGHLLVVLCVFRLGLRLLGWERHRDAAFAALLFGLQPVAAEAHVWINGRSDIFATLFVLLAAIRMDDAERAGMRAPYLRVEAGVLFLAACLCKEVALLAAPALMALDPRVRGGRTWPSVAQLKTAARDWAPVMLAIPVYLSMRGFALGGAKAGTPGLLPDAISRLGLLWMDGLRNLVLPGVTSMRVIRDDYAQLPAYAFAVSWLLAAAVTVRIVTMRRRFPLLFSGWVALCGTLAPVAIVACSNWPGFGRYLYLPWAILCFGCVEAMAALREWSRARSTGARGYLVEGVAALWVVAFATLLAGTISSYRSMETLYARIIDESPHSALGYAGLGRLRLDDERFAEAAQLYAEAVRRDSGERDYWLNLGLARLFSGDPEGAYEVATRGIQALPDAGAFYNLAVLSQMNVSPESAALVLVECLRRSPDERSCPANLRRLTAVHPRRAEFRDIFSRLAGAPENADVADAIRREMVMTDESSRARAPQEPAPVRGGEADGSREPPPGSGSGR